MESVLNSLKDFLISSAGTYVITLFVGVILSYLKKGDFKSWGVNIGKLISKFANVKIGKERWEAMEDALTVSFVSFAVGIKEGADYDDDESKTLMEDKTKVGNLPYVDRTTPIDNKEVK